MTGYDCYSYSRLPLCSVLCLERTWWSGLCAGWWRHWCLVLWRKNPQLDTLISFLLIWPLSTQPSPPHSFPQKHFPFPVNISYKIKVFYASIHTWKKLCNLPGPQLAFQHYLIFLRIEFHSECPVNIKYLNSFHEEF